MEHKEEKLKMFHIEWDINHRSPFLNPTGTERPEASSLCTCDSVVLAPMAPHETKSAMNWGEIVSRNSTAAGTPISLSWHSNSLAMRKPLFIWQLFALRDKVSRRYNVSTYGLYKEKHRRQKQYLSSRKGSLISPFHPTVVLGFSKYTLMIRHRSSLSSSLACLSLSAVVCVCVCVCV